MKGNFEKAYPFYLREENFESIKKNLDKLVVFKGGLDEVFKAFPDQKYDGFNLSDIFEYMSKDEYAKQLKSIVEFSEKGARLAFWNMLAKRKEVASLKDKIEFLNEKGDALHKKDKAFFYQDFVLGQVK